MSHSLFFINFIMHYYELRKTISSFHVSNRRNLCIRKTERIFYHPKMWFYASKWNTSLQNEYVIRFIQGLKQRIHSIMHLKSYKNVSIIIIRGINNWN